MQCRCRFIYIEAEYDSPLHLILLVTLHCPWAAPSPSPRSPPPTPPPKSIIFNLTSAHLEQLLPKTLLQRKEPRRERNTRMRQSGGQEQHRFHVRLFE